MFIQNLKILKITIILFGLIIFSTITYAQSVGIGTITSDPDALLDVASTNNELLIARMDSTQRAKIATPAIDLLVYKTNGLKPGFYYHAKYKIDAQSK